MALGGKTLLRRENGIVFLRPPQATAFLDAQKGEAQEGTVSSPPPPPPRAPPHLRLPALSGRDHLFTGRCDLVIPPLSLGNVSPSTRTRGGGGGRRRGRGRRIWKSGREGWRPWRGRQILRPIENYTGIKFTSGRFTRSQRDEQPATARDSTRYRSFARCFMNRHYACHRVLWRVTCDDAVGQWNDGEKNLLEEVVRD